MIFHVTKRDDYENKFGLTKHRLGEFWFYCDNGWKTEDHVASKGTTNNWCKLDFNKGCRITHNKIRDFPLWYNDHSCTNIESIGEYLPTDAILNYEGKWHVSYDNFISKRGTLDLAQSEFLAAEILTDNVIKFAEYNDKPVVIADNNGLDTLLVRGLFDHLQVPYEIRQIQKRPYGARQAHLEQNYYGFNQIEISDYPVVHASGFYGDEYMLRNPFYVQSYIEQDLVKIFDGMEKCYMKWFFNEVYRNKCIKAQKVGRHKVRQQIMNDVQVWHLDDTYVFNPFRDHRMLKLIDSEDQVAVAQVTDGVLSKRLIARFNPDLLPLLHAEKNTNDPHWFWQ